MQSDLMTDACVHGAQAPKLPKPKPPRSTTPKKKKKKKKEKKEGTAEGSDTTACAAPIGACMPASKAEKRAEHGEYQACMHGGRGGNNRPLSAPPSAPPSTPPSTPPPDSCNGPVRPDGSGGGGGGRGAGGGVGSDVKMTQPGGRMTQPGSGDAGVAAMEAMLCEAVRQVGAMAVPILC